MLATMSRNWWVPVVRGVLAILFGTLAIAAPVVAMISLVFLFGIYAGVDGIMNLVFAFNGRDDDSWWWNLFEGVVGILAALAAFFMPGLTGVVLAILIGAWAVITGIFEIIAAVRLRREIEGEWWLGLAGALSLIFGVLVFISPLTGALAITWVIGIYAIIFGVALIGLGLRLRGESDKTDTGADTSYSPA